MMSLRPAWRRFLTAAKDPRRAQLDRLAAILSPAADSAYGRAFGINAAMSVREFQDRVPVVDYGELAPWIERIAQGEQGVLTTAPVLMMERSSGSTAGNKLIPYTQSLRAEFSAATGPWLRDMHRTFPAMMGRRSYWSISPVARQHETTAGGLPVGFEDDTEYFGPLERWALSKTMAVDPTVARAPSVQAWFRSTARQLMGAQDLGMISVWSPTFLVQLMQGIEDALPDLLAALKPKIATAIKRRLDQAGVLTGEVIWPHLALVSCWTDGPSAAFLPSLRARFPTTPIQPKGLLATEGVVSFPMGTEPGAVIAAAGHFIEFEPETGGQPVLIDALETGKRYTPLLTTSGGFYRYRLGDLLEVLPERFERIARVRFVGRVDGCSDMCGEKVDPAGVADGVSAVRRWLDAQNRQLDFCMLAPASANGAHYDLFLETAAPHAVDLDGAAQLMERQLLLNHHYRYCRELGQLGPVQAHAVQDGWRRYERRLTHQGVRLGDIKPRVLAVDPGWHSIMLDKRGAA